MDRRKNRPKANAERDRIIMQRVLAGGSNQAIAAEFGVTKPRISQIKREQKQQAGA
jgi:transposase